MQASLTETPNLPCDELCAQSTHHNGAEASARAADKQPFRSCSRHPPAPQLALSLLVGVELFFTKLWLLGDIFFLLGHFLTASPGEEMVTDDENHRHKMAS